jgi:hypothetical protein
MKLPVSPVVYQWSFLDASFKQKVNESYYLEVGIQGSRKQRRTPSSQLANFLEPSLAVKSCNSRANDKAAQWFSAESFSECVDLRAG